MKHSRSGIGSSLLFSICTTSNRRWLCLAAAIFSFSGPTLRAAPGDLYSSDFVDATVIRYSADGTKTTVASTAGSALTGIAFDGKGNLFVAQYAANKIMKVTPHGDKSTFVQGLKPAALAFDRFGNLYAGD
jgi:sugar lactone lactonase YvrE